MSTVVVQAAGDSRNLAMSTSLHQYPTISAHTQTPGAQVGARANHKVIPLPKQANHTAMSYVIAGRKIPSVFLRNESLRNWSNHIRTEYLSIATLTTFFGGIGYAISGPSKAKTRKIAILITDHG